MSNSSLIVERHKGQFVLSGLTEQGGLDAGVWSAIKLDQGRVLVYSKESGSSPGASEGFAKCSNDMLHDILLGLNHRRWTGVVAIDTGFGQKKIFLNRGELAFASSTLMDDRLGEVMYREGAISLDQLTNSAAQVDRNIKFGQVLLRDRVLSNTQLWSALKTQVREIFRSVFLVRTVYVELMSGSPPTEVTFDEGTERLIESAHSSGCQFRAFFERLRASTTVVPNSAVVDRPTGGTFLADMIQLVSKNANLSALLESSKLADINTLWVLHKMSCLNYVAFSGLEEAKSGKIDTTFANLRSRLDAFALLQGIALKAFASTKVVFPLEELRQFAWGLNEGDLAALYIDDRGFLGADCVTNIMSQCQGNAHRIPYFEVRVDSLIRYMLQICGDLLPPDVSRSIKTHFAEISA